MKIIRQKALCELVLVNNCLQGLVIEVNKFRKKSFQGQIRFDSKIRFSKDNLIRLI
jgi:hypothetical protein